MDKCPYCGSHAGLYSIHYGVRYAQYYDFNGDPTDYSDLSEERYTKTKRVYCIHCDNYIGLYDRLFKEGKE